MSEQRNFPDWQELYKQATLESLPWYYEAIDPDLDKALGRFHVAPGKALDLGTGPATQAFALASRGFEVTGTDVSSAAVERAVEEAKRRGISARFVQDDILSSQLRETFDVVFDRGCFHVFPPERRDDYVRTLHRLVAPQGLFFLKCFSAQETRGQGPYRFSPDEIRSLFAPRFEALSIEETAYQGTLDPWPRALFCALRPR